MLPDDQPEVTTPRRKAIPRSLRFEILRRDNHACRYCGATAPEAALTVDHVIPVALGGADVPENLVAACRDCNAGKAATNPSAGVVADVSEDQKRWATALRSTAEVFAHEVAQKQVQRDRFYDLWTSYHNDFGHGPRLDDDWERSIDRFYEVGMTGDLLDECVRITMRRGIGRDKAFRYFCGVAWRMVGDMQEVAVKVAGSLAAEDEAK